MPIENIYAQLEEDILIFLYESVSDHPEITPTVIGLINYLREKETYSHIPKDRLISDIIIIASDFDEIKNWVVFNVSSNNKKLGTIRLTSQGKQIVEDLRSVHTSQYPLNIEQLFRDDSDFLDILSRDNEGDRVKEYFSSKKEHVIVLNGQPSIGKSRILNNLFKKEDNFVPLTIDFQSFSDFEDFDNFLFYFLEIIITAFNEWSLEVARPELQINYKSDVYFTNGESEMYFIIQWENLLTTIPDLKPILIFDEISSLIDSETLDTKIIEFLTEFCQNENYGYFVLVGTENIFQFENDYFRKFIGIGEPIYIGTYPKGTSEFVLKRVSENIVISDKIFDQLLCTCDEHPMILSELVNKLLVHQFNKSYRILDDEAVFEIINQLIINYDLVFLSIFRSLSYDEITFLWLVRIIYKEYAQVVNNSDLQDLAHQLDINFDSAKKGIRRLIERGWFEWSTHQDIRIKFGIFIIWMQNQFASLEEALNEYKI